MSEGQINEGDAPNEGQPGETPEWFKSDKYNTIEDQAKAYTDLEKSFGQKGQEYKELESKYNAIANKEAPETYEIELSPELSESGFSFDKESPIFEMAANHAKESGYSQEEFGKMVNMYGEIHMAEAKAQEAFLEEQKGLINNFDNRSEAIDGWAKANLDSEQYEAFAGLATDAKAFEAIESIITKATSGALVAQEGAGSDMVSEQELQDMMFKTDDNGHRLMSVDPEYAAKVNDLYNKKYGTAPHKVVVG